MRVKPGQITEHTRIVYQEGYDDGLQEGERRGWEKAIEAAAELMWNLPHWKMSREKLVGAIRKLKKP